MRNLVLSVVALAWIAACGPSGREIGLAKTARYRGDKFVLFGGVKQAVEGKYKLAMSDETTLTVITTGRWYRPEGTASNWQPGDMDGPGKSLDGGGTLQGVPSVDGRSRMEDRSINVQLTVRLLPEGENWIVHVEPRYLQFRSGRSNLDKLRPDDPSLPGWAPGKVDQLAYEIYRMLRAYEVKKPGGVAPAPEPQPQPEPQPEPLPQPEPAAPAEPPATEPTSGP